MRRRRVSHPERTDSASGISGLVPYIGHSTVPTTRPRASATRNPAVRRRSVARALIAAKLFPACEENPPDHVKLLLAPFPRHRQPGDREQHEVDRREPCDEMARNGLRAALPPVRDADRG